VDLGANYNITGWKVKHAEAGGESASWNTYDFVFQQSTDNGSTYTDVDPVYGNTSSETSRTLSTSISARYVGLKITIGGADNVARIYEFKVYGTPANVGTQPIQVNLSGYYNEDGWSPDTNRADCDIGGYNGYGYSSDLLDSNPTYENVAYTLGPKTNGQYNEVKCTGQTVTLQ
jgi:hypothetical protein